MYNASLVSEKIKRDLPNFSDEVIKCWLEPYGKELGWPPVHDRWSGILFGKPLEFWRLLDWEKIHINLMEIPLSTDTSSGLIGMKDAYLYGVENAYKTEIKSGPARHMNALRYIFQNGKMPGTICMLYENGTYSIVDGNHRYLAWLYYRNITDLMAKMENKEEYAEKLSGLRRTLAEKWRVESIIPFSPIQEVWLAKLKISPN